MTNYILSTSEKILLSLTVIVVFISIILSLCIGLVLPSNFINGDAPPKNSSDCKCDGHMNFDFSTVDLTVPDGEVFIVEIEPDGDNGTSLFRADHPPYLVSLHTKNDTVQQLACSGVIILKNWILVGRECAPDRNDSEWINLKVRAGSDYWDKDGVVHDVIEYVYLEKYGPALLKVSPHFVLGQYINTVKVPDKVFDWTRGDIAYFLKGERGENNTMYVNETWAKNPQVGSSLEAQIGRNVSCYPEHMASGALTSTEGELIAFRVGLCQKQQVFLDFQNGSYANWIRGLVVEGEPRKFIVPPDTFGPIFIYRVNLDKIPPSFLVPRPIQTTTVSQESTSSTEKTKTTNTNELFGSKSSSNKKESTSTTKKDTSKDDLTREPPIESEISTSDERKVSGTTSTTEKETGKDYITRIPPTGSEMNYIRRPPSITDTISKGYFPTPYLLPAVIGTSSKSATFNPSIMRLIPPTSKIPTTTTDSNRPMFGE